MMMREIDPGKSKNLVGKRISFVFKHVEFEVPVQPLVEIMLGKLREVRASMANGRLSDARVPSFKLCNYTTW